MPDKPIVDLNDFAANQQGKFEFKSETLEEKASRLRKEEADANFKRWQNMILHIAALLGAVVIVGFCLFFIANKNTDAETKKWATTTLTALVTGVVGYLFGKATPKE